MRSDSRTYEKVAEHCSCFKAKTCSDCGCKNTTSDGAGISCINCDHFSKDDSYCRLDLYDEIVKQHQL